MTLAIRRLASLPPELGAKAVAGIERIFFATSGTQTFFDARARLDFRERWLGRYLTEDRNYVWLAISETGEVAGYLVGCLSDPAGLDRFADIGYFRDFAIYTRQFPAHLHVNLDAAARGHSIGTQLVEAFCDQVRKAKLPGVHVVTGKGVRNVAFYERLGFTERSSLAVIGREIVFLGREL